MPIFYRILKQFLLFSIGFVTFVDAGVSLAQESIDVKKIQVLHGSNDVGTWRKEFDIALYDFVQQNSNQTQSLRLAIDYTGVENIGDDSELSTVIDYLKSRQRIDPASIVVSVLPPSAMFLETYGDEIYPGVKRLHVASELRSSDNFFESSNDLTLTIDGDLEAMLVENLRLIPSVVPGLTDLFVLSGSGEYGGMQETMIRELLIETPVNSNVHFLRGTPLEEVVATMNQSGRASAALLLSYEYNDNGNNINTQDALNELVDGTDVPIFGIFDSVLGRGVVGGFMSRAQDTAFRTGEVAVAAMNEQQIVRSIIPYNYLFDGRQLDRVGINRSLLPENSIIQFDSQTVWETYLGQILFIFLVIAIQTALIILLVKSLRKQKASESALKSQAHDLSMQKNLFESVINSIPDAVLICRVDRTIYAANKSTKEVFNMEPDEIIGAKANELIEYESEEQRVAELQMLDSMEDSLEPIILKFKKKDGSHFTGETVGTKIISSQGNVLGYFSLVRDVTRRLSREQEERQTQKMEALGTLVGGIAHDFNNVLGVIGAYAELLGFDEKTEEGRSNIGKIMKATQRGSDLCNQIMSFSRDMSVEQKSINLLDVANETIKLLSATIPSHIKLNFSYNGNEFPLYANFTQLQQILLNLTTNSSHAIGKNSGEISISINVEEITDRLYLSQGVVPIGEYVVLKVTDSGCGISEENLNRIFEPFYTTKNSEGTGMGLAMVYKIVRAHNGVIHLDSRIDRGTNISIYFPKIGSSRIASSEELTRKLVPGNGERILLVDDEIELLESVKRILMGIGYDVDAYSDSVEALKSFKEEPAKYDLLISDQVMPGLNGTGLMQSMREVRNDLPVILCTGYSEVLDESYNQESDISTIMRKPFTAIEMSHSIEQALTPRFNA